MNIAAKTIEPDDQVSAFRREIPDHKDIIKGELAQHGEWIVANISTDSFWPITSQKLRWRGVDIWILPIMKEFYPAVAMMVPKGRSRTECEELVMRFLSVLSWVEDRGFMVEGGGLSGGNLPRPLGRDKERGFSICDEFDLSYFPEVTDEKAMLVLALMREGRGLNHVGYAFLSFYRVLEVAFPGAHQVDRRGARRPDRPRRQGGPRRPQEAGDHHVRRTGRAPVQIGPLRDPACEQKADHRPGQAARHAPAGLRTLDRTGARDQGDRGGVRRRHISDQLPQTSLRARWLQAD